MDIPKKIKICGLNYTVIFSDKLHINEGLAGRHVNHKLEMTLQKDDYHQEKIEQTFFHEVMHAININYIDAELSEKQIDVISNGIFAFLKDNNLLK